MALTVHLTRFLAVIVNGTKNPHRAEVAKDITDAILKKCAANGRGAKYWTKEEQARRLQHAFEKWLRKSGVWSAAASQVRVSQLGQVYSGNLHANKVYTDQMNHVRKGCLARKREDIRSDGSRIEGSHKGWNYLQRAQPSGLAVFVALGHDHVLHRNIHIVTANNKLSPFSSFDASTFGSHHTRLANYTAKFWNRLRLSKPGSSPGLLALPEMTAVSSDETFGLVNSECATTFGGLFSEVKAAPRTEDLSLLTSGPNEDLDLDLDLQVERGRVVDEFGINLSLFDMPMVRAPEHAPSSQIASPAGHAEDGSVPPNAEVARPVEQTRNGMGRMVSPPFRTATVRAHSNLDQSVHSPDTVTPGPPPRVDSSPLKRKAVEHVDLTREGPGEPAPASKRLRLGPATTVSLRYRHSSFYFLTDSRLRLHLAFA